MSGHHPFRGIVGGIWAAGKLKEFSDWALGLTRAAVVRMLDPSFRAPGAMRAERVLARVHELVVDEQIENLAVPITFHRAEEMISLARSAAAQALEERD